jgi:hypothetical protein
MPKMFSDKYRLLQANRQPTVVLEENISYNSANTTGNTTTEQCISKATTKINDNRVLNIGSG